MIVLYSYKYRLQGATKNDRILIKLMLLILRIYTSYKPIVYIHPGMNIIRVISEDYISSKQVHIAEFVHVSAHWTTKIQSCAKYFTFEVKVTEMC